MITTVTLSPCIDKTVKTGKLNLDAMNRIEPVSLDIGGKGINVSRALSRLGVRSRALGFNFSGGEAIPEALEAEDVECRFTQCAGSLRTNLKIMETDIGRTVEINESNPCVSSENIENLKSAVARASKDSSMIVLAGSVPKGVGAGIYRELGEIAKEANPDIKVILDAQGVLLEEGLKAEPFMIKPNIFELETIIGKISSEDEIVSAARKLIAEYGVQVVLVSRGEDGAVIVSRDECYSHPAVKVPVKSTSGAGDSMVAGAILALTKNLPLESVLRYAVTAAAGAISHEGTTFCTEEEFERLLKL
ncbi:MAG: 1-phosphofructokinase family hexose kinase [Oscillospiraceae bacterium]|nr:1-phosphofructokinase family hexose kinase [Oscillospiraceae bacterium]